LGAFSVINRSIIAVCVGGQRGGELQTRATTDLSLYTRFYFRPFMSDNYNFKIVYSIRCQDALVFRFEKPFSPRIKRRHFYFCFLGKKSPFFLDLYPYLKPEVVMEYRKRPGQTN